MTKNTPLVTVAIPSYNHAHYIEECIRSVAMQNWKNIELIIIDDGSTDNSRENIDISLSKYKNNFKNIKKIFRENKGLSNTLNEALQESSGEYFMPLASDDTILPNKINLLIPLFQDDFHAVYGGIQYIDPDGKKIKRTHKGHDKQIKFKDLLLFKEWLPAAGALFKKDALINIGGFDPKTKVEDLDILLRFTSQGYKIFFSSIIVAHYRIHETNTSKNLPLMHKNVLDIINNYHSDPLYKRAVATYESVIFRDYAKYENKIKINNFSNLPYMIIKKRFFQGLLFLLFKSKKTSSS